MVRFIVKRKSIVFFLIALVLLRPTFTFYGSMFGRISDFFSLLILGFIVFLLRDQLFQKSIKKLNNLLFLIIIYIGVILLSLFTNNFFYMLTIKDFIELIRPLLWFMSMLAGFLCIKNKDDFYQLLNIFVLIGTIHGFIGMCQYFFYDYSGLFFKLFSTTNLFFQHRSSGIVYSHTEYSVFAVLLALICFYLFNLTQKKHYLFLGLFQYCVSILSFSKAGFIYFLLAGSCVFLYFFIKQKISIKLFILTGLLPLLIMFFIFIYSNFSMFYGGFIALLNYDTTSNLSIKNRVDDIVHVLNIVSNLDYRLLIGSSPLRAYSGYSYIEETFFNILFRYGFLGVLCYYSILFFPFTIRKTYIKQHYLFLLLLKLNIILLFFVDFTANVSETLKLSTLIFLLYGSFYKYTYIQYKKKV